MFNTLKLRFSKINKVKLISFATIIVILGMGYYFIKNRLVPYHKDLQLLNQSVLISQAAIARISRLCQTSKDSFITEDMKNSIIETNLSLSLPLTAARVFTQKFNNYQLGDKLYNNLTHGLQKISNQHEYILLHHNCPSSIFSPPDIEQWKNDTSNLMPQTWIETAIFGIKYGHFENNNASSKEIDPIDCLFALGESKIIDKALESSNDISPGIKKLAYDLIFSIEKANSTQNNQVCRDSLIDLRLLLGLIGSS